MRTRLSSRGQLVLPKKVRDRLGWAPGTELDVEVNGEAVIVRVRRLRGRTTLDELVGCIPCDGPAVSPAEMDTAVDGAARGMWERFERQQRQKP